MDRRNFMKMLSIIPFVGLFSVQFKPNPVQKIIMESTPSGTDYFLQKFEGAVVRKTDSGVSSYWVCNENVMYEVNPSDPSVGVAFYKWDI